jgi:hypothetical protein
MTSETTDLRLVAVAPDRSHLVLEDSEHAQFRVPLDERLVAALRTDRSRPGQLEIPLYSQLSPREIQSRIRAGHSVDEVSLASGMSPERVERYAGPVIAERGHVVEQAQRAPARRASNGQAPLLLDLVNLRLVAQGTSADSAEWDAWRGDDERWTVRLAYLAGGRQRVATWSFDTRGRVLAPADDEARWLVDDTGDARADDAPAAAVRRLSAVPGGAADEAEEQAPASPHDQVYDREADEARAAAEPVRAVAAGRSHRRTPVPSWDDIMFGTRKHD